MTTMSEMLTLSEFAKRIGATYNQVYGWVTKHGLPHVQIGTKRYVYISQYEKWVQSKITVQTKQRSKADEALEHIKDLPGFKFSPKIAATMDRIY